MRFGNLVKTLPRIAGWALALAGVVAATFFGIAGALSFLQGTDFLGSQNAFIASVCAVIAWFFVAFFLFGKETITMPVIDSEGFLKNARRALREMGYDVTNSSERSVRTRHGFQLLLFGRGIRVRCTDTQATLSGPKLWVDALRRRLRVQNCLDSTELSLSELTQRNAAERGVVLKRVQLQMRVPAARLEEVTRNVVAPLADEGEVLCEVTLMAQSSSGIREATVEEQIRPWLLVNGITADIQKDSIMMAEAPSTTLLPRTARRKIGTP
jgi:hypothetical protein